MRWRQQLLVNLLQPVVSEQPEHEEQRTVTSGHSTAAYVKDALSGEKLLDPHKLQLIRSHNGKLKFTMYNVSACTEILLVVCEIYGSLTSVFKIADLGQ